MSGIFAIFNRLKEPVSQIDAYRMGSFLQHRGPDGLATLPFDYVYLGHNLLRTTNEEQGERLPFHYLEFGYGITSDARLDNRDELAEKLGLNPKYLRTCTDSELIIRSYRKWGVDCFKYLLGDFAIIIWDSEQEMLVCGRDVLGVKPLYYYFSSTVFLFCSEVKPLVTFPGVSKEVNLGMIGEYLCAEFVSQTETVFKNILRLAPAHSLVVTKDNVYLQRFWTPKVNVFRRYKKESDYIEEFEQIFTEAVKCRLRSHLKVSIELSGGLDSSSILSTVCQLIKKGNAYPVEAFSVEFPGMTCNEIKYIESIRKYLGISVDYSECDTDLSQDYEDSVGKSFALPDPPNMTVMAPLFKKIKDSGSRVVLTGIGGDEWFSGSNLPYLDLLFQRKMIDCWNEWQRYADKNRKGALKDLVGNLFWPMLPYFFRLKLLELSKKKRKLPSWLSDDFVKSSNILERLTTFKERANTRNLAKRNMLGVFYNGVESRVLETNDRYRATFQVEGRHPFLDQRIAEFALSLPEDMRKKTGWTKYILRLAANGKLPEFVVWRKEKAEFSQLFFRTFEKRNTELRQLDSIVQQGWIDKKVWGQEIDYKLKTLRNKSSKNFTEVWEVWFALAIDMWYKNIIDNT